MSTPTRLIVATIVLSVIAALLLIGNVYLAA